MKRHTGGLLILALALAAAGCAKNHAVLAPAAPLNGGSANLSVYVAMGTSISAGFESGGLVVTHQTHAFPALFAHQINQATFTIPSISADGIPALLRITGVTPLGGVIISNAGRTTGAPTNFTQPTTYHNMGIPGALLADAASQTYYYTNPFGRDSTMFHLIARDRGTVLAQVAQLAPTLISFEYGANEILGPASQGSGAPILDGNTFAGLLNLTLNGVQASCPNARLVLFTVPDPTTIPFMTTFKTVTLDQQGQPVALIGPGNLPLVAGDYITLNAGTELAEGFGFPVGVRSYVSGAPGNGQPLTDDVVLSAAEVASLRVALDAYNQAIRTEATNRGAALVDLHGLLAQAVATGLPFQGQVLTSEFVTGGLFSLDGVHPTDVAHGFICNLMIDAVNAQFGANIPHVDLNAVATATSSRAQPAGTEGAMPWVSASNGVLGRTFPWRR